MARSIHLLFSRAAHARLLKNVDRSLPVYEFLANGIVEKDEIGQERVRVFCDGAREEAIYDYVQMTDQNLLCVIDRVVFTDGAAGYQRLIA